MLSSPLMTPLSFTQQRLWFLTRLIPHSPAYNFTTAFQIKGVLNRQAFIQALTSLCKRHEILRTTIQVEGEQTFQKIHDDFSLSFIEIQGQEKDINLVLEREAAQPFDLERGPLLRTQLLALSSGNYVLQFTLHHIIADHWSMRIFFSELSLLYDTYCNNQLDELPELAIQYADFAVWQRQWLQGDILDKQITYWKRYLKGAPDFLDLPTDKLRPTELSYKGKTSTYFLDAHLIEKLHLFSQHFEFTPFVVLFAVYQLLLYRYTQQIDIVTGYVIANRHYPHVEKLIGFFANTLVLRTQFHSATTFNAILKDIKESILNAYDHQDIPFEQLIEFLKIPRRLNQHPVFQTMFLMEQDHQSDLKLEGLQITPFLVTQDLSKFDLTLTVKGNTLQFEYATDLFEEATIARLAEHFAILLEKAMTKPFLPINKISLITAEEQKQFSIKDKDVFIESTLTALFEEAVEKFPFATAIAFEDQTLTYDQLNQRANEWAHHLQSLGIEEESLVAICLERSVEMISAILGVLKAGGAYVPLETNYPIERLDFILKDTEAKVLITHEQQHSKFSSYKGKIIFANQIQKKQAGNLPLKCAPHHLAYVIYTSGSTGIPKGVMIEHKTAFLCVMSTLAAISLTSVERFVALTSFSFDVSVLDYFLPFYLGAQIVIANQETIKNPYKITELIQNYKIQCMQATPTTFQLLIESGWKAEHPITMLIAGEALPSHLARELLKQGEVYNIYGPTEATIYSTFLHVKNPEKITIGLPFPHVEAYILDDNLQPVPIGVAGELYLGGLGLARGYLKRPELTAEKFLPHPFSQNSEDRLYKTGDLSRRLSNGQIEFLGRIDDQVKIRGHRIELGEIASALKKHERVKEAIVIAKKETIDHQKLIAYVIPHATVPSPLELRMHLEMLLPDYMLPSAYVDLKALPINSNGKLDKSSLPTPEAIHIALETQCTLPRTEMENVLCNIWSQLLNIKNVGIHDNFFHIGGDSIISLQFVSKAKQKGIHLDLKQVFKTPTISALAQRAEIENLPEKHFQTISLFQQPRVKLTPIQKWFFNQELRNYNYFNQAIHLQTSYPLDPHLLKKALEYIVAHHDAFQLRFQQHATEWRQEYYPDNKTLLFTHSLEMICDTKQIQESLNIHEGPLFRAVLFCHSQKLFLCIHHLIIDGVSWRILLKDLETVYHQIENSQVPHLPLKTSTYQMWSEALYQYAETNLLKEEIPYWQNTIEHLNYHHIIDFEGGSPFHETSKSISFFLDEYTTTALLKKAPQSYHTQVNDILLTALVLAFGDWQGNYALSLTLEGHGREPIDRNIDVSQTIGWFTSLFPIHFFLESPQDLAKSLKSVKEALRRVPNKGLGYGVIKYLTDALCPHLMPRISFNYLGQWENSFEDHSFFKFSKESIGDCSDSYNFKEHLIEILIQSKDNILHIDWTYSSLHFYPETIEKLGQYFLHRLQEITLFCCNPENFGYTPSDFPLAKLDQEMLDQAFGKNRQVEEVYPLTPMQEGILFGTLYAHETDVYVIQTLYEFKGDFDQQIFQEAWKRILTEYSILRTGYLWEGLSSPHQFVLKSAHLNWFYHNFKEKPQSTLNEQLINLMDQDRKKPFDLSSPPLFRQHWIEVGKNHYFLLTTKHHIVLDGWSDHLLLQRVVELYEKSIKKIPSPPPLCPAYKDYVDWIQRQDLQKAEVFWKNYLRGITTSTRFSEALSSFTSYSFSLSVEETQKLHTLSKQHHLTLNTLLQGAWGLFLTKYLQQDDLLFGITLSGRNIDLPYVENMAGLCIQTLPFRIRLSPQETVLSFLRRLQEEIFLVQEFGYISLRQLQKWSQLEKGENLFDHLFIFENFPTTISFAEGMITTHSFTDKNEYSLTLGVFPGEQIHFLINSHFTSECLSRIGNFFKEVISKILINEYIPIRELSLLTEDERKQIIVEWNCTYTPYPSETTLQALIEEQVKKTPTHIACVFQEYKLTYQDLNRRANQFASFLKNKGVSRESLIAVSLERSLEMVIALLGILKTGGAYVPLDPFHPQDRLRCILDDTQPLILVTQSSLCERFNFFQGEKLYLDQMAFALSKENDNDLFSPCSSANLAYVIYTSGSTGMPKGVCISHQAIVNRILWMQSKYQLQFSDKVLQKTPFSFDVSVWEFFWPLISGAELHVAAPDVHRDSHQLIHLIQQNKITVIHFVPSMLRLFLQTEGVERCDSLRLTFSSGEALTSDLEKDFFLKMKGLLHNLYGPTEAAVDVTYWECQPHRSQSFVPIGKPIANIEIYILDAHLNPVPIGFIGELHIGGVGLARGYLNKEDLTKQKFIPHPFSENPDARLYKTGDLARYLPDGNIEYIGRVDRQVKIRGFRIELGEIENTLKKYEHVQDALVIVNQKQQLYAYIIPHTFTPTSIELQKYLESLLPSYMIPAVFLFLSNFPLTSNGKIDKKALPQPEFSTTSTHYPATEEENILIEIWKKLLNIEKVGVHDNFFQLGGDSILSIQLTSLARQQGIHFEIKQIFETPTIAGLLQQAKKIKQPIVNYEAAFGVVEMTPMQLWFFEKDFTCYNHFNQAMLLNLVKPINIQKLEQALNTLVERHEALQFKYRRLPDQWQQIYYPCSSSISLQYIEAPTNIEEHILKTHQSIDIEKGELFKAVYFDSSGNQSKLLLIIHHLVTDGLSWRILLKDLELLYLEKPSLLPAKTAPCYYFAEALKSYGNRLIETTLPFWTNLIKNKLDFPIDFDRGANTNLSSDKIFITFTQNETFSLLRQAPRAYRTEINDLLLTALVLAKGDWHGEYSLYFALEGHGRENIDDHIDISQTIGWFTSLFPVLLTLEKPENMDHSLKSIKEQLRKIPQKGLSYGILKYLMKEDCLKYYPEPQLVFNYLGQWHTQFDGDSLFQFAPEPTGPSSALENQRSYLIGINAEIREKHLQVGFKFSMDHYKPDSIIKFATYFQQRLQQIINYCSSETHFGYTPSDFSLANVGQEMIDQVFNSSPNVEDVYPLGPMQQSLLFHTLYEPNSHAYLIQTLFEITGNLSSEGLREAFDQILQNHSILRTAFIWKGLPEPLQVVYQIVHLPWSYHEIKEESSLQLILDKDLNERFDLTQAPLFRLHFIRLNNERIYLLWTRHHLILDGWSGPLIIQEALSVYHQQFSCHSRPYKDYIAWLSYQNKNQAKEFWKHYLKGYKKSHSTNWEMKSSTQYITHQFSLSKVETEQLVEVNRATGFSLNTILQGAWSLLLKHYLQSDDFIFGVTVSGRHIDLPGIDQMAGLFIHTLPLRIQTFPEDTILSLLERIQKDMIAIQEHALLTLSDIQSLTENFLKKQLFDHIVIFENYPKQEHLQIQVKQHKEYTEFPLTIHITRQDCLHFTFSGYVNTPFIHQISRHLRTILTKVLSIKELCASEKHS